MTYPKSLGRENVLATYGALARCVPGTVVSEIEGCLVATGPIPVSFSNFAAGFDWTEEAADSRLGSLVTAIGNRPVFWYFVDSDDLPLDLEGRFRRLGGTVRQSLVHMAAGGSGEFDPQVALVAGTGARAEVARFMTEEFFRSSPESVRETVALATAESPHDLAVCKLGGDLAGAVMLTRTPRTLGVYNLCVRPDCRSRGVGAALVRSAVRMAADEGRRAVLQCEELLVPWYFRQGFEVFGEIKAMALPKGPVWGYTRTS